MFFKELEDYSGDEPNKTAVEQLNELEEVYNCEVVGFVRAGETPRYQRTHILVKCSNRGGIV